MSFHQFIQEGAGWETQKRETEFANPHVQVWKVKVSTPGREKAVDWTIVHRKAGAVVIPMTAEGKLILVRQERVPIHQTIWEFPAGQIDDSAVHQDEAIRAAALRELREEAGYELAEGGELISLGYYFSSVGFTDEHCYMLLAKPVVPSQLGQELDQNEVITGHGEFSPEQIRAMIASNEIRDANTLSCFARMSAMGLI